MTATVTVFIAMGIVLFGFADAIPLDFESRKAVAVKSQELGKNSKFSLVAYCQNLLTNELELQFSELPQVVASTCNFVLGFENGLWFYASGGIDRLIIPNASPVPDGCFVFKLDLFFATDGSLKTVRVSVNNTSVPAIERLLLQEVQTAWCGVRAFSRGLCGQQPDFSAVLSGFGTVLVIQ